MDTRKESQGCVISSVGEGGDAWERFERAVDAAVKSGPKPKPQQAETENKKDRPASKGRVHKGKTRS